MTLVVVLSCLLLVHWLAAWIAPMSRRIINGYLTFTASIAQQLKLGPVVSYIFKLSLMLALVGSAQWWCAQLGLLSWSVFSLAFLLLAWGCEDLDRNVHDYLDASNDDERLAAARMIVSNYQVRPNQDGQIDVVKGIFYQSLVRWFGVLFWFLVSGVVGALLFRMVHSLLADGEHDDDLCEVQRGFGQRVVSLLDFPPAVLSTVALAVVGNFDAVIAAWKRHFQVQQRSWLSWDYAFLPHVGCETVMRGSETEDAFEHDYQGAGAKVNLAMNLVWRALVFWLTVIAMLVIFGQLK